MTVEVHVEPPTPTIDSEEERAERKSVKEKIWKFEVISGESSGASRGSERGRGEEDDVDDGGGLVEAVMAAGDAAAARELTEVKTQPEDEGQLVSARYQINTSLN